MEETRDTDTNLYVVTDFYFETQKNLNEPEIINNADLNVDLYRSSTAYHIAKTVVVPADATLDVISKSIYLEEGDSLRLTANANSDLEAVCSYEIIA